jgi:hypothetical protein
MTFNPDFRNGEFDIVPLDHMTEDEREELGLNLFESVSDEHTRDWLLERHLDGVVGRHDTIDSSLAAAGAAYNKQLTTNDDYYGLLVGGNEWVGMGTIMPSLPLRAPHAVTGMLPTRITRQTDYLSKPVITHGPNVTAWVNGEHGDRLIDAYGRLGEIAGKGAWTIEPVRSARGLASIRAAGFTAVMRAQRYDDMETGNTPPLAQYFERKV